MCGTCFHKYDVKCNTPDGLATMHYCRNKASSKSGYGFDIVKPYGLCTNYTPKNDGTENA